MSVPLYYTGLASSATVTRGDGNNAAAAGGGAARVLTLRRDYSVLLEVSVKAESYGWWVIS